MSLPDHLRPPEALTLGLQLGHLCIITLHSEGHRTVAQQDWARPRLKVTCPGEASRDRGHCGGTVYTVIEFLTKPSEEINF